MDAFPRLVTTTIQRDPDEPADESDGSADAPESTETAAEQASVEAVEAAAPHDEPAAAEAAKPVVPQMHPADPVGDLPGSVSVQLETFEGPLDLLLHLVRRHELDILDIPISFVCEKYLEYLAFMRALDLEVAGDYLVMAATLAYLKSRELVPQDKVDLVEGDETEDGPDPREELIARLLEYQKFKAAAEQLDRMPLSGRDVFDRGAVIDLPPMDAGLAPITLYRLAEAYNRVLERARVNKSHEVVLETVSVAQRMQQLTMLVIERPKVDFEQLFLERQWSSEAELRSMLVVTLMSILELVRMGILHVHQPIGSDSIVLERATTPEEARRALSGYDEAASFGTGKADPSTEQEPNEHA